jgi:sucrose-6-phosphate hydrolase SacC (GH32 family)
LLVRGVGVSYDARAGRLECCGQVAPLKPEDGKVTLEVIVDRTSVEIFANRGRLYLPVGVLAPQKRRDLVLFSREAPTRLVSLEAWPLKPIW